MAEVCRNYKDDIFVAEITFGPLENGIHVLYNSNSAAG